MGLIATYVRALREEPKARVYLAASVVDDIGVAVSGWAATLAMADLYKDQRARASVILPSLVCFLVGSLISGPLADWERVASRVAVYRWKLVVWGRFLETLGLATIVVAVARGLTLTNVMPYILLSAFLKTALRPARESFFVDLLQREEVRLDAHGERMRDEAGAPLRVKVHLLTFGGMMGALRSASILVGLLIGGVMMKLAHGKSELLFLLDLATTLVFVALIAICCHPTRSPREMRWRELLVIRPSAHGAVTVLASGVRHFFASLREAFVYLRLPAVRPLLWILFTGWLIEVFDEFYSGDMIVKHVLHGSDDALRYANIVWTLATVAALALVPALSRRTYALGRIFLVAMLLDGLVVVVAGQLASGEPARALVPFVGVLATDRSLTALMGENALLTVAIAGASSASMRGRIFAVFVVFGLLGDVLAEAIATPISERYGVPAMVSGVGAAQIALMVGTALIGGAALWRYGIRTDERQGVAPG